ncbi:MAG: PRC-barrel domain-containing protein [Phycisphaerales bacterium]|nr:PRC-barrel domain-containing protein [Planctomycetota bacterium]
MRYNTSAGLVLVAALGGVIPVSAFGQPQRTTDDMRSSMDRGMRQFASADHLRGSKVENANKDNVGKVDDLLIERGSGVITYVVLDAGGFLGIGTKQVAVPFTSFGWDAENNRLTLEATKEQVKSWPEFQKEAWTGNDSSLSSRLSTDYYKSTPSYYSTTPSGEAQHVKGKVIRIDRRPVSGATGEDMVVTVLTDDNREEQVIVGPSWYMTANPNGIYRDAPIDIRASRFDRDGNSYLIARSLSVNSREYPIYDDKGSPRWWNSGGTQVIGYPFMLSKDVDGKKVRARGEQCGKVDDLLIERGTGRVAFLSIDPDQNFLGIGDTKRLIPWEVATTVTTDNINIDATKSMIVNSPQTPSDLKSLSGDGSYRNVYTTYGISEPYYYDRDHGTAPMRRERDLRNNRPGSTTPPANPVPAPK